MFDRSRNKIILSIMGSLILLFAVTITAIMAASYHEIRQKYQDMLEHYVEMYSLEHPPGSLDDTPADSLPVEPLPSDILPDSMPDFQLSTFYSVALDEDHAVLAIDDGKTGVYSEEELVATAKEILAAGKESGNMGSLAYIVAPKQGYTLVAFIDNTVSLSNMNTLQRNVLVVGGTAIVVLLFISFFLAKAIIKPLEENDRRQKRFISDASHELKTPVAVISTNAEMLEREIGENEWLANIRYENERMGDLIRQLLDLSQAESFDMPKEQLDFSRIVAGETLAFESFAYDSGKTIQSDIEEHVQVSGSRTQLTRLVSVLLDNAIRHSTGSIIEISLKYQGHSAVLTVSNEGEEILPDQQAHLFDRFYRVDEVRNSEDQHYGLGLSIAKASVENHGGNISVSCHDGKVQFTVSIPANNI